MIPLVDLSLPDVKNISENSEWIATAGKVREGLGGVGFLYIVNHNIPQETIDKMFKLSKQFFELPIDVKLKFRKYVESSATSGGFDFKSYSGYTPISGEVLHPSSKAELKETFDWLDKGIGNYPTEEFSEFYKIFQQLDVECKQLTKKLLRLLAISLKLPNVNFFLKHCRHLDDGENYDGLYNMRMIHYPPIPEDEPIESGTVRCGEHSDYGILTLLFQDDVGGLEVKSVDGEWLHAKPIPGSILVNTGDLIEFWTSGIFPATPHRIIVPDVQDEKRRKSRYSVAFFNGPDFDAVVTPMDLEKTPVEKERLAKNGKKYSPEPVKGSEHMLGRVAKQYV